MELMKMMELFNSSEIEAPIASGICAGHMEGMLDCNDVDGNCINCD